MGTSSGRMSCREEKVTCHDEDGARGERTVRGRAGACSVLGMRRWGFENRDDIRSDCFKSFA